LLGGAAWEYERPRVGDRPSQAVGGPLAAIADLYKAEARA